MPTYVYRPKHPMASENGYVEKSLALEWDYLNSEDKRAMIGNEVVTMNFISDIMEPTKHMANGKIYTSKSTFRQVTKASGCIEVGDDKSVLNPKPRKMIMPDRKERREHIAKAIHDLKNGKKT